MIAIEPLDGATVSAELFHEANLAMDLELVLAAWVGCRAHDTTILDELHVSTGSTGRYSASRIKDMKKGGRWKSAARPPGCGGCLVVGYGSELQANLTHQFSLAAPAVP